MFFVKISTFHWVVLQGFFLFLNAAGQLICRRLSSYGTILWPGYQHPTFILRITWHLQNTQDCYTIYPHTYDSMLHFDLDIISIFLWISFSLLIPYYIWTNYLSFILTLFIYFFFYGSYLFLIFIILFLFWMPFWSILFRILFIFLLLVDQVM